jgi:hypothetical protein
MMEADVGEIETINGGATVTVALLDFAVVKTLSVTIREIT